MDQNNKIIYNFQIGDDALIGWWRRIQGMNAPFSGKRFFKRVIQLKPCVVILNFVWIFCLINEYFWTGRSKKGLKIHELGRNGNIKRLQN